MKRRCQCLLQRVKRQCRCVDPAKAVLAEKRHEGGGDGAEVADETTVVAHEAEEAANRARRLGNRPVEDRLHLTPVHRHACAVDDMAEVGHGRQAELTLGAFKAETNAMA